MTSPRGHDGDERPAGPFVGADRGYDPETTVKQTIQYMKNNNNKLTKTNKQQT